MLGLVLVEHGENVVHVNRIQLRTIGQRALLRLADDALAQLVENVRRLTSHGVTLTKSRSWLSASRANRDKLRIIVSTGNTVAAALSVVITAVGLVARATGGTSPLAVTVTAAGSVAQPGGGRDITIPLALAGSHTLHVGLVWWILG